MAQLNPFYFLPRRLPRRPWYSQFQAARQTVGAKGTKAMIAETINMLGLRAKDKVSGFEGVISSVCFDLYGCVQVVLAPPAQESGKLEDSRYFDVHRLEILSGERVMEVPVFAAMASTPQEFRHGPAEKPARTRQ